MLNLYCGFDYRGAGAPGNGTEANGICNHATNGNIYDNTTAVTSGAFIPIRIVGSPASPDHTNFVPSACAIQNDTNRCMMIVFFYDSRDFPVPAPGGENPGYLSMHAMVMSNLRYELSDRNVVFDLIEHFLLDPFDLHSAAIPRASIKMAAMQMNGHHILDFKKPSFFPISSLLYRWLR
jgi:hypothetical protein